MEATNETTQDHPQNRFARILTVICDKLPVIGRIREHRFTSSLGAGIVFTEGDTFFHQGKKVRSFKLWVNTESPLWSSTELRELASECTAMAEYLEKQST